MSIEYIRKKFVRVFEAFFSKIKLGGYSCFGEGIGVYLYSIFSTYSNTFFEYFRILWDTLGYFGIILNTNTLRNTYEKK